MRWSQTLIPTLRETPQDAEIESHKWMLRAGLIRKLAGGLYTFLPVGLRALRNVERIVREEMDRAGALEVLMPALQPTEIWETSGRLQTMRQVMFKVRDRQERELVLGPTHEEVITELVAREIHSHRQLPRTFYQIQTKFRDEIRPRFGLMRAREFIMKDAYSFDPDEESLERSYRAMYDAYTRIFSRCSLRVKIVEADTGAMGGRSSHEFMALADAGEDGLVECDTCAYAANLERAERARRPALAPASGPAPAVVATPGARTIEEVSSFLDLPPSRLIKTLVYLADGRPVAALVAGDRELNEVKFARALGCTELVMADPETIQRVTGAPVGFTGPVGLSLPLYADHGLEGASEMAAGANQADAHMIHVALPRDATPVGWFDLANARTGDPCPRCSKGTLREMRGIEVGHVFKLGTKYSEAFQAIFLDAQGQKKTMLMGCYGIGVTRTLQAIIEQGHDQDGILWPASVAPFHVEILPLSTEPKTLAIAAQLEETLQKAGLDPLLDDRDERPGVKFKDADLIGCPIRMVIGERGLATGKVEIRRRTSRDTHMVPIEEAAARAEAFLS